MAVIDLITGFLGAGKTTFLRGYTDWLSRTGQRFCVIENEYGAAGVDAASLRNANINVEELSGGCICCSMKVGFHDALLRLSEFCDRIVVEPSGIFAPDDFFDVVESPMLSARCRMGAAAAVCDVHMTRLGGGALEVLRQELCAVGLILISKTQTAGNAELAACESFLRETLGDVPCPPILSADWSTFTDRDYERVSRAAPPRYARTRVPTDHSALFSSATLRPGAAYEESFLRAALDEICSGACGEVLRVKGYLNAAEGGCYFVNCTVRDRSLVRLEETLSPVLNVIGTRLERKKMRSVLENK